MLQFMYLYNSAKYEDGANEDITFRFVKLRSRMSRILKATAVVAGSKNPLLRSLALKLWKTSIC